MDFQQHLDEIHKQFRVKLETARTLQEEVIGSAVAILRDDIQNPDLTGSTLSPDTFMLRANQAGLALLEQGFFAAAEQMYRTLATETLRYRQGTKAWRHAGALFANTAGACAAQGKLDQSVIELLKAAQHDVQTYRMARHESFAVTDLLQVYFRAPAQQQALSLAQTINPSLTLSHVESLCKFLGSREYAFLAYVQLASVHEKTNHEFPNEFSRLQLFSALRSLSALLEIELKTISDNMQSTLFPAMRTLYESKGWWQAFESTRVRIEAIKNSKRPVDDQLGDAITLTAHDDNSRFWKSLLVAYIVRNYTTHWMETECALVQSYSHEALGHILHVMIVASNCS